MKTCDTCTKRIGENQCAVLNNERDGTLYGMKKDCFAYSDDPGWEKKVERASLNYFLGWRGRDVIQPKKGSRCG